MLGSAVLITYAVLMILATVIFTRKTDSTESFHVADRNIGTGVGALSIAATWIWAPALFVSAEKAYTSGIPGIFWFLVPNVLCLILFIPFAKRMKTKYPQGITLSGFMAQTYKSKRVCGAYSFQLGALAVLSTAVQLLAGGKMLSSLMGIPFWAVTVILAAIALSYSLFSGIKASVATDVLQLAIIAIGCAIIVPMAVAKSGGLDAVAAGLGSVSGEYTSLFSSTGLEVFLGFGLPTAIGLLSGPFGDQCFWQRTFSIRKKSIGKAFLIGALVFALIPASISLLGFSAAGTGFVAKDASMVNVEYVSSMLSPWVMVPFLMMVLSGLLSTVDSNLCAAASLTTDVSASMDSKSQLRMSRWTMVALLLVSIAIANIPGITVTSLFLFYGALRASTLLPTVLTLCGKKLTANGVFFGILASLCVGLPIFAVGNICDLPIWKTAGSLTAVLLSGIVASFWKGAKR